MDLRREKLTALVYLCTYAGPMLLRRANVATPENARPYVVSKWIYFGKLPRLYFQFFFSVQIYGDTIHISSIFSVAQSPGTAILWHVKKCTEMAHNHTTENRLNTFLLISAGGLRATNV
jgi:hypothetical protein